MVDAAIFPVSRCGERNPSRAPDPSDVTSPTGPLRASKPAGITMTRTTVEVSVTSNEGVRIPIGLMTPHQALALPEEVAFEASHPDHEVGNTDVLLDREMLQDHVDAAASSPST